MHLHNFPYSLSNNLQFCTLSETNYLLFTFLAVVYKCRKDDNISQAKYSFKPSQVTMHYSQRLCVDYTKSKSKDLGNRYAAVICKWFGQLCVALPHLHAAVSFVHAWEAAVLLLCRLCLVMFWQHAIFSFFLPPRNSAYATGQAGLNNVSSSQLPELHPAVVNLS